MHIAMMIAYRLIYLRSSGLSTASATFFRTIWHRWRDGIDMVNGDDQVENADSISTEAAVPRLRSVAVLVGHKARLNRAGY